MLFGSTCPSAITRRILWSITAPKKETGEEDNGLKDNHIVFAKIQNRYQGSVGGIEFGAFTDYIKNLLGAIQKKKKSNFNLKSRSNGGDKASVSRNSPQKYVN